MKLTILGTGNAMTTKYYNTCFVLSEGRKRLLVDGGGGNGLLVQLERADIDWRDIRDIFVTHKHVDHLLGIIWMMRLICQNMSQGKYQGEARIYAHEEVIRLLLRMGNMLLLKKQAKFIALEEEPETGGRRLREEELGEATEGNASGNAEESPGEIRERGQRETPRLRLVALTDGQEMEIIGHRFTFFDIHSAKDKQFGFSMELGNGEHFTCCGDEPCNEYGEKYADGSSWLMHEAFCLHSQADLFRPYEKHHSTVKDACELAQRLHVKNLILYHTEDQSGAERRRLYGEEGSLYYRGNLYIPEDLEEFELQLTAGMGFAGACPAQGREE